MSGCLAEDVVAALAAGALRADALAEVERHLDACSSCRRLVAAVLGAASPAPSMPQMPQIGRYLVRRLVGTGGMGAVYAAIDPDLEREVALKVVHPVGSAERDPLQARLAREAKAMARLAHPNVVTVFEVGSTGDRLFIAMELVAGTTLRRWCNAEPRRDWRAIATAVIAAGRGLAAAHAAGVIHRDFKPDNVLVGDDGRVRVGDFGLALLPGERRGAGVPAERTGAAPERRGAGDERTATDRRAPVGDGEHTVETPAIRRGSAATALTASGALVGTPAYMAPEQLHGEGADERSEVFSFSVVLWEALFGERPFGGADLDALLAEVTAGSVRAPREDRGVPVAIRELVRRGLAPSRADRPASMAELLALLDAALAAPSSPLFGRAEELAQIDAAIARARVGEGALLLAIGEAGIGKSRLVRELAARAGDAGMRVVWGRCWEGGGAAPFWPWLQVLRAIGAEPPGELGVELGERASEDRFRRFDAIARALAATAQREPLAIVLEDLHAADIASLLALVFVAAQLAGAPVLITATARPADPRAPHEHAEALARVVRAAQVLALRRLDAEAVRAWIAARAPAQLAAGDEVHAVSEGNPLFVAELLRLRARHASDSGAEQASAARFSASAGIAAVLDAHLARLPAPSRELLELASAIGRELDPREVAMLAGLSCVEATAQLAPAVALGVLEPADPVPGTEHLQFTHNLLRERLYHGLAPARRAAAHWRLGLAAAATRGAPARIAHHLLAGVDAGDPVRAARAALEAADACLRALAFEEGLALAERGLAVLGGDAPVLAAELDRVAGEALLRAGAVEAGHARCLRAAATARSHGAVRVEAESALAYACEHATAAVDPRMVQLLEDALAAVAAATSGGAPEAPAADDRGLAARLNARLSAALVPPARVEDLARISRHAVAALAAARELGDAETLVFVLHHVRAGASYAMHADERFALTQELVALARSYGHRLLALRAGPDLASALLERGRRADGEVELAITVEQAAAFDAGSTMAWRLRMARAAFAMFDGDAARSTEEADAALAEAGPGPSPVRVAWAQHRIARALVAREPALLAGDAERILAALGASLAFAPQRSCVLAAIGRRDEAAALLEATVTRPYMIHGLVFAAEACALLGDRDLAPLLHAQLTERCPGARFFWGGFATAFAVGPIPHLLGELALLAGDTPGGRAHLEASIDLCRRIGARPFLARSLARLAEVS